jgi:hypothetical protein
MVRRTLALACAAVAAAVAVTAAATHRPPEAAAPLPVGAAAPRVWAGREGVVLAWVVGQNDYLTCQTYARDVRHMQRRYGTRLKVVLTTVGSRPEWIDEFLRLERLQAEVVRMTPEEYRRELGAARVPAVYVVRDGWIRFSHPRPPEEGRRASLAETLERELKTARE